MDPNAALIYLDKYGGTSDEDGQLLDHFRALYYWLLNGGFEPDWDKYPRGKKNYTDLLSLQDH